MTIFLCLMSKCVRRGVFDDQKKVKINPHLALKHCFNQRYTNLFSPFKPLNLNTQMNCGFACSAEGLGRLCGAAWHCLTAWKQVDSGDICNLYFSNGPSLLGAFYLDSFSFPHTLIPPWRYPVLSCLLWFLLFLLWGQDLKKLISEVAMTDRV